MSEKKQKSYPGFVEILNTEGKCVGFVPLEIVDITSGNEIVSVLREVNNVNEKVCEHKYVHQSTNCYIQPVNSTTDNYVRIDMYYCEKCLEEKAIKKEHRRVMFTGSDTIPDWWINKEIRR